MDNYPAQRVSIDTNEQPIQVVHVYLGEPIPGVISYLVRDAYGPLAGPAPWCIAKMYAGHLADLHPSYDIEVVAA